MDIASSGTEMNLVSGTELNLVSDTQLNLVSDTQLNLVSDTQVNSVSDPLLKSHELTRGESRATIISKYDNEKRNQLMPQTKRGSYERICQ